MFKVSTATGSYIFVDAYDAADALKEAAKYLRQNPATLKVEPVKAGELPAMPDTCGIPGVG